MTGDSDLDRKDVITTSTSTHDVEAQTHRLVPTLTGGTGIEKTMTTSPGAATNGVPHRGEQSLSTTSASEADAQAPVPARPPPPPFPTAFGVFCLASCGTVSSFLLMGWSDMTFNKGFALGTMYFYVGGVGMIIAGIFEMINGNALAFCVFGAYSAYWAANGAVFNGSWGIAAQAAGVEWAGRGPEYLSKGIGYFQLMYVLITAILWAGCLFTNVSIASIQAKVLRALTSRLTLAMTAPQIVFVSIFTFIWPTLVCLAIAG